MNALDPDIILAIIYVMTLWSRRCVCTWLSLMGLFATPRTDFIPLIIISIRLVHADLQHPAAAVDVGCQICPCIRAGTHGWSSLQESIGQEAECAKTDHSADVVACSPGLQHLLGVGACFALLPHLQHCIVILDHDYFCP